MTAHTTGGARLRLLGDAYAVVVNGPDREISDRIPGQVWVALPATTHLDVVVHTGTTHLEVVFRCKHGGRHTDIPITTEVPYVDRLRVLVRMDDDDSDVITYPVSVTYVRPGDELRMDWGPTGDATA